MHLIFVHVIAEGVMARDRATATILSLGVVLAASLVACGRLHSDVLLLEVFGRKLIQEVLLSDTATLLIRILEQDLIKALDNGLHNFLEAEAHSFLVLVIGSDILLKLLINLLDDPVQPVANVRVSELDLLAHIDGLLIQLLR